MAASSGAGREGVCQRAECSYRSVVQDIIKHRVYREEELDTLFHTAIAVSITTSAVCAVLKRV